MNILVNYANEDYRSTQRWNSWSGKHIAGFDKIVEYSPEDIDEDFRQRYAAILSIPRGNGLWLWKPYFIHLTLQEALPDDIVCYSDSGSFWVRSFKYVLRWMKNQDIWASVLPFIEWQWTRRECFELLGCITAEYRESNQCQGGFLAFRKNAETLAFTEEWLKWCCDIRVLAPLDSQGRNEIDGFCAHREDQSVLSLLLKKHHIRLSSDPSQFGKYPELYSDGTKALLRYRRERDIPLLILHHRQRTFVFREFRRIISFALCPEWLGHRLMHRDFGNILPSNE